MFQRCPKCGHHPLPANQALPEACPACGVILAKLAQGAQRQPPAPAAADVLIEDEDDQAHGDPTTWWPRTALLAGFALWGIDLMRLDYRDGEINQSFIHRPLLIFHEAGHVLFMPFGEWMTVLGGSLFQLLMPAILAGALLFKNRDHFGAAIAIWLLGVSLLDLAPYVYDALHPQLTLLNGSTGEEGGHDWIYLLSSMNLLASAQRLGALVHALGAGVVLAALGWAGRVLWRQRQRLGGH